MVKSRFSLGASVLAAAFMVSMTGAVVAQEATPATDADMAAGRAHPAHIHSGTCDNLGDVVYPLEDVTLPSRTMDMPEATPQIALVAESVTTIDVALDDILSGEHAINVHLSADEIDTYIACGDITGEPGDGLLDVDLAQLNDTGYSGQATLVDNDGESTTITVTIIETELDATPSSTPVS